MAVSEIENGRSRKGLRMRLLANIIASVESAGLKASPGEAVRWERRIPKALPEPIQSPGKSIPGEEKYLTTRLLIPVELRTHVQNRSGAQALRQPSHPSR
eukprot:scaffold1696_cov258-Pinguiococcus_pyrenoidosus.AAC.16